MYIYVLHNIVKFSLPSIPKVSLLFVTDANVSSMISHDNYCGQL